MRRTEVAARIADLVGDGLLTITSAQAGWPSLGTLNLSGQRVPVSVFAGPVTLSHRDRDTYERRFQNPGQNHPIVIDPDHYPLLLGLLENDDALQIDRPVLVLADAFRREGRNSRFSVFASTASLAEAAQKGWSEDHNTAGEMVRCLYPPLLPVVVAALIDDAIPASTAVQAAIEGSGLAEAPEPDMPAAAERARRAASALVRDARFARRVISAYDGRCAMCGLNAELVQAAHIYPAAAPGSHDEPWNGIALCPNHHLAFDRHMLAVSPSTRQIVFGPGIHDRVPDQPDLQAFVSRTYDFLAEPSDRAARPRMEMFTGRYKYFAPAYIWLTAQTSA
jgi:hypothetical protein